MDVPDWEFSVPSADQMDIDNHFGPRSNPRWGYSRKKKPGTDLASQLSKELSIKMTGK